MDDIARRSFLQGAVAVAGGVLASGPLQGIVASAAGATPPRAAGLEPVADLRDGKVRLHLPRGFEYRSFHDTDGPPIVLNDGTTLPGRHDGMAAFRADRGHVWLVRNHEVNGPGAAFGPGAPYDPATQGGTTTVKVTKRGEVVEAFTSLNGTQMNCSGGRMPWGSWITCEETVNGPDVGPDFTGAPNDTLQQRHGYLFEVPAGGQSNRQPIRSAGRFAHEAAAYSPDEGYVYLTEDDFGFPSGLYRYKPPRNPMRAGRLVDGGRLEMLRVKRQPNIHLEGEQRTGATYDVDWVPIDDPDPTFPAGTTNNAAIRYVGDQGRAQGAAFFSRLEGAAWAKDEIVFTSTQGGGAPEPGDSDTVGGFGNGTGQVWSYDPRRKRLTCRYQSPGATSLELPDNVTVRDDNGAIVLCEDGPVDNYVRALDRRARLTDVVLNRLRRNTASPDGTFAPRFGEEFAGATFSPDGETLFVNIQASQGITFAIWGNWNRIGV